MPRPNRTYKKENGYFRNASYKLIVGEGLTEEQYFKGLLSIIDKKERQRFKFEIQPYKDDGRTAIKHLVTNALEFRGKFSDFKKGQDEIWVFSDMDLNNDGELNTAAIDCKKEKMNLAISTPCFEIWLLLHLSDLSETSFDLNPIFDNKKNRKAAQNCELELRKILGGYNKSKLPLPKFLPHIELAIERAKLTDNGYPDKWPTKIGTRVYKLLEDIKFKLS